MHRCADAVAELMEQLGYSRYIVQGGDWGALVTRRMGEAYADRLIAVHFNMLFANPLPGETPDMSAVTEDEQRRMAAFAELLNECVETEDRLYFATESGQLDYHNVIEVDEKDVHVCVKSESPKR